MWEGGERIPSPITQEQEKPNEDDDKKQDHIQNPQRQSSDEDVLAETGEKDIMQQSMLSPSIDTPVCAKNISLTASGERVILWTR